jgi:phage terminase large subunit
MGIFTRPPESYERAERPEVQAELPPYWRDFWDPAPYKVLYGGRGGAKSWSVARSYIMEASKKKYRYLCTREFQSSMKDSVHKLLTDQIFELGLENSFTVTEAAITSKIGSEFMFKGLKRDPNSVRSTERIDRCWVEEAHAVSSDSWQILLPTLFRTPDCELTVTFNPYLDTDPTYVNFVKHPPPGAVVRKVGYQDNPWFPKKHDELRRHMLATDPDAYSWIWGGNTRQVSEAIIFRDRVTVDEFTSPPMDGKTRFFFGVDWGFANDPTCMIRMFIHENVLFIDHEAYGYHVELDDLPALFAQVPGCKDWPIGADNARPETISYLKRKGFPRMYAADKWKGSVEDGLAFMKSFKRIVIHPRCPHIAEETRLYSYKVEPSKSHDPAKARILPIVVKQHDHGPDACRYGLGDLIKGGAGYFTVPDSVLQWSAQPRTQRL